MSTMQNITEQMTRDGYGDPMPTELLRTRLHELVQMRLVLPFLSRQRPGRTYATATAVRRRGH